MNNFSSDCRLRKTKKNPDVLTKVQLVDIAHEKFEIKKYKAQKMKKAQLCTFLDKKLSETKIDYKKLIDEKLKNAQHAVNEMKRIANKY